MKILFPSNLQFHKKKYLYWLLRVYSLSWFHHKLLWTSRKQRSLGNWEHCRLPSFFIAQLKDYIKGTIPQLQNSLILQGFCASSSREVHAFIRIVDEVKPRGSRRCSWFDGQASRAAEGQQWCLPGLLFFFQMWKKSFNSVFEKKKIRNITENSEVS